MLIVYALVLLATQMALTVEIALSPICHTSIIFRNIPICGYFDASAPDYSQLMTLQSSLMSAVEHAGDHSLFQEVRSAEMEIRDLTTQLRVSDLDTRDVFVTRMEAFTAQAKDAARGLQHLSSRVVRSLDA